MIHFFTHNLLWTEGWILICFVALLFFIGLKLSRLLIGLACIVSIFFLFFFRNPERVCPEVMQNHSVVVCPSDGKVIAIDPYFNGAAYGFTGRAQKVSIFLSVFDVHVNWIPVAGIIERIMHRPGNFHAAFEDKSSINNECNEIFIKTVRDDLVVVRQIAGCLARRIVCWINVGQSVYQGQKFGMIKFGSRVEVILPADAQCAVHLGQRVYGGQTVLARLAVRPTGF